VTFLALLEILKLGLLKASQVDEFGSIWILRREQGAGTSLALQGGAI
jgi:chromatin segregation and condensation protein Rec8/ScpA/Scc1 (kleisin family)